MEIDKKSRFLWPAFFNYSEWQFMQNGVRKAYMVWSIFHPLIQRWFQERVGTPTQVQTSAWPEIAAENHVLITAPTGSGKTLTAFLWALNELITGHVPCGHTRVLYVSPLKALNNDIQRNLLFPLRELREYFIRENEPFPSISVMTRSGDTSAGEREKMLRHPPEILITTPESLNLLVSSVRSRKILTGIQTVILDEIHNVAGTKRGVHLITAVERLVLLAGEFQRIALSATVKPLDVIADFVGGYKIVDRGGTAEYRKREVRIIESGQEKQYQIRVKFPEMEPAAESEPGAPPPKITFWNHLIDEFKEIIYRNRSTLFFTNNRMHCERISLLINQDEDEILAYSHHGSLSRETRMVVEEKLKHGELKAIIATSSLELGIDIGTLDEVVLVQTPFSIAGGLQRIGRAGHSVGQPSKGILYPIHGRDLMEAAVMSRGILDRDIEEIKPIQCPLDVLAQIIVAMAGVEIWDIDYLYAFLKSSYPYHDLGRTEFDLAIKMLSGHYAGTRLRSLKPLISVDKIDNTVRARDGALRVVYAAGGTIPDRGYFTMRHQESGGKIGDLDEEFVWEHRPGDNFILGTQSWRIQKITHNDVFVVPGEGLAVEAPFWKAEEINWDFHFSVKIGEFLEWADSAVEEPDFVETLENEYPIEKKAAESLADYLKSQKRISHTGLPHRRHSLIEYTASPNSAGHSKQVVIHTTWGGRVNRPLALILASLWEERYGDRAEMFVNNDGISIVISHDCSLKELLLSINIDNIEKHLREKIEQSGFFGARFRENAARALILPRESFHRRTPLWLNRLKAKKLFELVYDYDDFPILVETWRTCLRDEFDLDNLRSLLNELKTGETHITEINTTVPSPFTDGLLWLQTNKYMYEDDTPSIGGMSRLSDDLLKEVVFSSKLRPQISQELIDQFEQKAQRVFPDYAPASADELLDWIKERQFIPIQEWELLLRAMERDHAVDSSELLASLQDKILRAEILSNGSIGVIAWENASRFLLALQIKETDIRFSSMLDGKKIAFNKIKNKIPYPEIDLQEDIDLQSDWVGQWLQFYGPKSRLLLSNVFAFPENRLNEILDSLIETQRIVAGTLTVDSQEEEICDSENFELLLRLARRKAVPAFEPLALDSLPLFLAEQQGVVQMGSSIEALQTILEKLLLIPFPVERWEEDVLPSRLKPYLTAWLDSLMQESDLIWYGCEKNKMFFCFPDQLDLLMTNEACGNNENTDSTLVDDIFPSRSGKYDFSQLVEHSNLTTVQLTNALWELVWQGAVTNDSFAALRKGILSRFKAWEPSGEKRGGKRSSFNRWKSSRPFAGNWFVVSPSKSIEDELDRLELQKEKVRIVMDRYGILFRELLQRELPEFRWGSLFKALRLMELSGELVAGCFFQGIPGLQFMSPAAFRRLRELSTHDAIFWINATDPASLCGLSLPGLSPALPKRLPTTHLVYHGTRLVMISHKKGKEIELYVPSNGLNLPAYYGLFKMMLERQFNPMTALVIETINGEHAGESEYVSSLRDEFHTTVDYRKVTLRKKFI